MRTSGIVFLNREPFLTDQQLLGFAEILRNISIVIFASQVLPYVFKTDENIPIELVILSLIIASLL